MYQFERSEMCFPLICVLLCRVYDAYSLEAILSTGFGRQVNIQLGESDEFATAMNAVVAGFTDGHFEGLILMNCTMK